MNRRMVLRGAGGLVLALPWLETEARAQTVRKRFVTMFTSCGTHPRKWFPTGGETDFQLSTFLAPLEAVRQDIVILGGINMLSAMATQPGDGHQRAMKNLFTAVEGPGRIANGITIDQQVASVLNPPTKFRSIELGVQSRYNGDTVYERISYLGANQPLPPEDSPAAAFKRLFGNFTADPTMVDRLAVERRSILDFVQEDFRRLSPRLGGDDRKRVDAHLASLRAVETRLTTTTRAGCTAPAEPAALDHRNPANFPLVGKLQMDILAAALACDLVRVGSLMWSQGRSLLAHTHLGISELHHELSHQSLTDAAAADKIAKINLYYVNQFLHLVKALKGYQEGGGTLLDNTVVLWGNELGEGRAHSHVNVPFVLAGRGGGAIRTGRYLTFQGVGHGDLFVSLLRAFGSNATAFGNPAYCTGPLAGLVQ